MGWIKVLFGFLDGLMSFINREKDRQSGRNEEKLDNLAVVEERWRKANEIDNEPIADDDVSMLLRPEDRTADNLRILQDSQANVSNAGRNNRNKRSAGAKRCGAPTKKTQ